MRCVPDQRAISDLNSGNVGDGVEWPRRQSSDGYAKIAQPRTRHAVPPKSPHFVAQAEHTSASSASHAEEAGGRASRSHLGCDGLANTQPPFGPIRSFAPGRQGRTFCIGLFEPQVPSPTAIERSRKGRIKYDYVVNLERALTKDVG